MHTPNVDPVLPDGYRTTGLIEAHSAMLAELRALEEGAHAAMIKKLLGDSDVFGLMGNNPTTRIAFVALRGTQDFADWEHNLDGLYEPYGFVKNAGDVHMGFRSIYQTFRDSIASGLEKACRGCDHLFVTGHSLGAALAVLCAPDLATNMPPKQVPGLITFAGPRAGLLIFHHFLIKLIPVCYRVVATHDLVPKVPLFVPPIFMYEHVGTEIKVDGGQHDPIKAHSQEESYRPGLQHLE